MNISLIKFPRTIICPVPEYKPIKVWISPCLCSASIIESGRAKGGICRHCGFAAMTEDEERILNKVLTVHKIVPLWGNKFKGSE
jgi:hypothetical protein